MSDENRQTRPTEMHEACRHPVRPSRRGLIAAGAALGVGRSPWTRPKPFRMQRLNIGSRVTREGHARF